VTNHRIIATGWQTKPRQFAQYTEQFQKFSTAVAQIHPNYFGVAWGVAHREGLESAIAFCESKIQDTQLMQAYRDSENASNY
jgi:hypothetical protein